MTINVRQTNRSFSRLRIVGAVVAGVLALAAATPARADHRDPTVIIAGARIEIGGRWSTGRPSWGNTSRDYERGYEAGRGEGFDAGYRDGLCGRYFCDQPRPIFSVPPAFREGYYDAYARAYRDGYEQGRCERYRPRSHHRGRW